MELDEKDDPDGEVYKQLMEATRNGLPKLRKIINEWEYLNIQKRQVGQFEALYNMLDTKKLSISDLRSNHNVMYNLCNKYDKLLEEKEKLDTNNRNQLDECENKTKFSNINSAIHKANDEDMEKEHNSPYIETVKSKEMGPIRVHNSPRDHSPIRFIGSLRIRDDLFLRAAEQTNNIQTSNDSISLISPVPIPCITNVRQLSENGFGSFGGNLLMKKKNQYDQYEVTNAWADIYFESGRQIVNNGVALNDTYCLIDTTYQKHYLKKYKEFKTNEMKSNFAFQKMISIPKIFGLFKCMKKLCSKVFSDKILFELHIQSHISSTGKNKVLETQINTMEQLKQCAYCFKKCDDVESLATHISEKYSFCKYFCPFCFYRAYTPHHVLVHQTLIHTKNKPKIIQLEYDEGVNDRSTEVLMVVDYNDFIMPYKCNVGSCTFSCFIPSDFIHHLNKEHRYCDKFCCYICMNQDNSKGFIALQSSLMIKHFILHNINMYQCIFCLFGSEFNDLMMNHLAMEHFEYESVCLERSLKSDSLDSSKVENLKIIRLTQTIDSGLLEIVNVTPEMSFLLENPEMLDDNDEVSAKRKLSVEHLSQESIDWPRNKRQRKMSVEHLTEESNDGPNKFKQTVFPFIELNKLFVCKECDKVFLNSKDYQRHLENFPKSNEHKKCVFCDKYFKTPYQMTEHVKCHGPDRFTCNICYFMAPSCQSIGFHMKNEHEIGNLELIPVNSKCTDIEIDKFIVDRKKYKKKKYQKILPKECNISFKCGECLLTSVEKNSILSHIKDIHNIDKYEVHKVNSSSIGGFKELYEIRKINSSNEQIKTKRLDHNNLFNQNIDKNDSAIPKVIVEDKNTKQFSPDTIDNIPMTHIFLNPIGCSLCTYNTKVRSNLILHLNIHKNGQCIITKEIVNPVPSIENSELMFDKMINLSASSYEAMISEKTKVDKLNTKIVEVSPINNLNTELFPQFIPKNKLFQCSEGTCNQQFFLNADLLKTHMSIIHEDFQFYLCPHCQPNSITTKEVKINNIDFHLLHHTENLFKCQYCDYIDFNRDEMRKHMRKTHLPLIVRENQYNIIVIRQSKIEDYSFDRNIIEVTKMYRCPMCSFEGDANSKQFEEHFKEHHPNVADKNQKVCDKITDAEQLAIQSNNHMGNTINNQEQRALESIDPRMPLSCRGIPIESNYTSESRFVSKNPKSAKQSQVKIKPEMFQNDFKEDDRLGSISKSGQFVCPKCNSFTTKSIKIFRDHLYKEIDSKKWKCMKCFLICNSAQKMSWHIKKHEFGTKYEKMENTARFKWVDRVIEHQYHLSIEFNKQKTKDIISVGRTVAVTNKMTLKTKKDFSPEKKVVDSSITPQMSVEVINLLNDFDDE